MQQEQAEAPLSEKKSTVVEEVTSNNNAAGSIVKTKKSSGSILNSNKPYTQSSKPESFKSYSSSSSSSSKPNPFKAVLEAKRQEKIEANRAREVN